jgi:hypothetical protein
MRLVVLSGDTVGDLLVTKRGAMNLRAIPPATKDMPKIHRIVVRKAMMSFQVFYDSVHLCCSIMLLLYSFDKVPKICAA